MAGHSHWAGIKHKKALIDNKRGKLWSRLSKAIIVAAKMGGGDTDMNPRLRQAVADAKAVSMPKDNIERAIKKGTGELAGGDIEELVYEGYGPSGVAVILDLMTDNRNRTAPEIRKIFEVNGGKLGATGCVAWMFDRKGLIVLPADKVDEEQLTLLAIEAGADDVHREGDAFHVTCDPEAFSTVTEAIEQAELPVDSKAIERIPSNEVTVEDPDTVRQVLKLMEMLDDHDDVQNVSANFDIPDEALAAAEAG